MADSFFRKIDFPSEEVFIEIKKEIDKNNEENFKNGYFKITGGASLFDGFHFSWEKFIIKPTN